MAIRPGRHTVVGPKHDGFLDHRVCFARQTTSQIQGLMAPAHHFPQRRLMIEPTQEIGVGCSKRGKRCQFEVPQIKQKQ